MSTHEFTHLSVCIDSFDVASETGSEATPLWQALSLPVEQR